MGNERLKMKNQNSMEGELKIFSNIHALIVEDNLLNQKMIQHTLKNIGITSECANNGLEGVDLYREKSSQFDIIFMDIHMPIMNGIESTRAILKYEASNALPHTPIIAVTAHSIYEDRDRFLEDGMDEYVAKPVKLEKFISAITMFFKEENTLDSFTTSSTNSRDVLLYKETAMEAKIISAILHKLNYSVDVVENIDELKKVMDVNSYKCILLDKVNNVTEHSFVSEHIKSKNIPSLLFVDSGVVDISNDEENFTFISDKVADYQSIKDKVDYMVSLT